MQSTQQRKKILLIDDSDADLYLFEAAFLALQKMHEIEIARDGEKALQHLHAAAGNKLLPSLILLDLNLPRIDGFEVLRAIRSDLELRAIPVIVVSSSSDKRQVHRAYEMGANAYVVKPLDDFVDLVGDFETFWLQRAELP